MTCVTASPHKDWGERGGEGGQNVSLDISVGTPGFYGNVYHCVFVQPAFFTTAKYILCLLNRLLPHGRKVIGKSSSSLIWIGKR